jgi:hypothetical protein
MDAATIGRLHPSLTKDRLAQLFADVRSYAMTITNEKTSINGDTAVVSCTISSTIGRTVGRRTDTFTQPTTLRLQKRGETWVIVDRR